MLREPAGEPTERQFCVSRAAIYFPGPPLFMVQQAWDKGSCPMFKGGSQGLIITTTGNRCSFRRTSNADQERELEDELQPDATLHLIGHAQTFRRLSEPSSHFRPSIRVDGRAGEQSITADAVQIISSE